MNSTVRYDVPAPTVAASKRNRTPEHEQREVWHFDRTRLRAEHPSLLTLLVGWRSVRTYSVPRIASSAWVVFERLCLPVVQRKNAKLQAELDRVLVGSASSLRRDLVRLGESIIRLQAPHALNAKRAGDGTVLFSLFGDGGREAELWVGEHADHFTYVLSSGGSTTEGELPIAQFARVSLWLDCVDDSL
jgi:hypothetical protein